MFRQIALSMSVVLSVSLVACGGAGAGMSTLPAQNTQSASGNISRSSTQSTTMTYVAPYGGQGGGNAIYLLAANGCGDIPVTPGTSAAFPANVANGTLAKGTMVTVVGAATNSSGAAITTGCPTGGIVATSVAPPVVATPAPTPSTVMTYVAPYGGTGSPGAIYLLAANGCGDIPVKPANAAAFPANVANGALASGTSVTVIGKATNTSGTVITTGCPTGGIVATSVALTSATASPSPSPKASPTAAPIATPAPAVSSSFSSLTNTASLPANIRLGSASSPWYKTLEASPPQLSNSTAIVTHMITSMGTSTGLRANNVSPYYIGTTTDPLVTVNCVGYGCPTSGGGPQGLTIHIPANSAPEAGNGCPGTGSDCHIVVLDTTSTNGFGHPMECDFYQDRNPRPLHAGQSFAVTSGTCYNPVTGTGWTTAQWGGTAVAGGGAILPSQVTVAQVQSAISGTTASSLNHALQIAPACQTITTPQFPAAIQSPQTCNDGSSANTAPIGAIWWSDVPCSTINANPLAGTNITLDLWSKVLLCTMNTHGGYETDTNGNSGAINMQGGVEDPERYSSLGNANVATAYYNTGVIGSGMNANLSNIPAAWIQSHIHVLQACVGTGGC